MNASSMCANCFGFLTPEGYCKKCRRSSDAAPLQKEEKVQKTLKDESATDVGGNPVHISYELDPKLVAAVNRATHAVERISELEYQVESLQSGVGKLAWGLCLSCFQWVLVS
jgi:hypothetical protein